MEQIVVLDIAENSAEDIRRILPSHEFSVMFVDVRDEKWLDIISDSESANIIISLDLGSKDGFYAKKLRKHFPELPLLFLSEESAKAIDAFEYEDVRLLRTPIDKDKLIQYFATRKRGAIL